MEDQGLDSLSEHKESALHSIEVDDGIVVNEGVKLDLGIDEASSGINHQNSEDDGPASPRTIPALQLHNLPHQSPNNDDYNNSNDNVEGRLSRSDKGKDKLPTDGVQSPSTTSPQHSQSNSTVTSPRSREKKESLEDKEKRVTDSHDDEAEDYYLQHEWHRHRKHMFIFADSGKPVYSRYGDESKLAGFFGLLLAMVSFIRDHGDRLKTIIAGNHMMVFLRVGELHFVAVSSTGEPVSHLEKQLRCMHSQIVSTVPGVDKIFVARPYFDIRSFLTGTDKFFDSLSDRLDGGVPFMLDGIRCLRLPSLMRDTISTVLRSVQTEDLIYAILLAKDKVVHYVRPRNYPLHPSDLELIINFIRASPSFTKNESWVPICLPKFNDKGYLYAYVCFLIDDVCLLLLSTDQSKEKFFELSNCKNSISRSFQSALVLKALHYSMSLKDYSDRTIGIPGLIHFMYKDTLTDQITYLALKPPYNSSRNRDRLFRLYQYTQDKLHKEKFWRNNSNSNRVFFMSTDKEHMLGWRTDQFELYAVFMPKPFTTLAEMVKSSNQILTWIRKEESSLFITATCTWS